MSENTMLAVSTFQAVYQLTRQYTEEVNCARRQGT